MTGNRPSGLSTEELFEVSVRALVREWGITEQEARDALLRARRQEARLGREMATEWLEAGMREAAA